MAVTIFLGFILIVRPRRIHCASVVLGLCLLPYGLILVPLAYSESGRRERVRERFPYQSLEGAVGRVPVPVEGLAPETMGANLAGLERELDRDWYSIRAEYLQKVHTLTLLEFVDREGLGIERMPMTGYLEMEVRQRVGPFKQTGPSWSINEKGDQWGPRKAEEVNAFDAAHWKNIANFAFSDGFGFVKDRAHVAGFESHRFKGPLESAAPLKVVHIELVSLLLHDPPVVYQSDELPRLDRGKQVPTRSLDPFESAALARIKKGEDLIVAEVPKGLRMLGSIRNAKQCIQCHGGKRGDLLGAFTYCLEGQEEKSLSKDTPN